MKGLSVKKLKKPELQALVTRFEAVGKQGIERTDPAFLALLEEEVRLDLPLGELLNPAIAGLVMVWKIQCLPMVTGPITDQHQFNAQGLEGLVSITMRLAMTLLTATKVDLYRMDVFVPPSWKGGEYCGREGLPEEEGEEADA
jgi:hypothetical protein